MRAGVLRADHFWVADGLSLVGTEPGWRLAHCAFQDARAQMAYTFAALHFVPFLLDPAVALHTADLEPPRTSKHLAACWPRACGSYRGLVHQGDAAEDVAPGMRRALAAAPHAHAPAVGALPNARPSTGRRDGYLSIG